MKTATRSLIRISLRAFFFASSVALSACLRSTEPQPSLLQLNGSWKYTGAQTGPLPETLTGTLTISSESGTSFQGQLHLEANNSQTGTLRLLDGLVSGTASVSNVVDFDANVESTPRRHVGQIVADTITGTWIGSSPDGTMSSGTFRAERETR
jgi:hypothetical protein